MVPNSGPEWSDLLAVLTLSTSLNFGFGAFTQIRDIVFIPERDKLNNALDSFKETERDVSEITNTNKKNTLGKEVQTSKAAFLRISTVLGRLQRREDTTQEPVIFVTAASGLVAAILTVYGAIAATDPVETLWILVSVATNFGWFLFLVSTIFFYQRLRSQVRTPRIEEEKKLAEIEMRIQMA